MIFKQIYLIIILFTIIRFVDNVKLNVPRALLPIFQDFQMEYTLQATDGCYKWHTNVDNLFKIMLINADPIRKCSRKAQIIITNDENKRQTGAVFAENTLNGQILRCDITLDQIYSLKIETITKELHFEEGPEKFQVIAYDSQGNSFSTLENVEFEWIYSDNLKYIKFLNSAYEIPEEVVKLEQNDKMGAVILLEGVKTGSAKIVRESEKRIKSNKNYFERSVNSVMPIIDEIINQAENDPNSYPRIEIIDHILTLYAASEDTLSNISSFAAICFGIYPQYQRRAYNEILEIIGDQVPENITISDLNKLTYLDRCLKDVLRLFPIAPYIARNVEEDLELDSIKIPQGVGFIVPIFNLHYSPKYWKKPNEFNPDHFLEEAVKKRPVYSYIPFSAGTRGCIGKTLAILSLKLYLCHLLLEYEISTDLNKIEDLKLKMDITVRSTNGYKVKLKNRLK